MAGPRCDLCELEPSSFMLTHTETGDTQAVCGPCLARSGLEMAKALLPPEEILERLGIPTEPADGAEAEDKRPRKAAKREAPSEPPAEPEPAPTEALAEEPSASANGGDTGL